MSRRLLTRTQAAAALGVATKSVTEWAKHGMPRQGAKYPWPQILRWREEQLREQGRREISPSDADEARARKLAAEAELVELEVAQVRGEMVTVTDVEREVGAVFDRLRARIMAMPGRWAQRIVNLRTLPEAKTCLEDVMREQLNELAGAADDLDDDEADDGPERAA